MRVLSAAGGVLPGLYITEHIIAKQHGGSDRDDNLAYACGHCNPHKDPNIADPDPPTGQLTPLSATDPTPIG